MAMRQIVINWENGGAAATYIPDRFRVMCASCRKEVNTKDIILTVIQEHGTFDGKPVKIMKLVVACAACGSMNEPPIVE